VSCKDENISSGTAAAAAAAAAAANLRTFSAISLKKLGWPNRMGYWKKTKAGYQAFKIAKFWFHVLAKTILIFPPKCSVQLSDM